MTNRKTFRGGKAGDHLQDALDRDKIGRLASACQLNEENVRFLVDVQPEIQEMFASIRMHEGRWVHKDGWRNTPARDFLRDNLSPKRWKIIDAKPSAGKAGQSAAAEIVGRMRRKHERRRR
jgi:hypothetical protein